MNCRDAETQIYGDVATRIGHFTLAIWQLDGPEPLVDLAGRQLKVNECGD